MLGLQSRWVLEPDFVFGFPVLLTLPALPLESVLRTDAGTEAPRLQSDSTARLISGFSSWLSHTSYLPLRQGPGFLTHRLLSCYYLLSPPRAVSSGSLESEVGKG